MDSMTEMFYDESNDIFQSIRHSLLLDKHSDCYGQEVVMEIFRGVHTLKADSAMMLYENMAELSRQLESLLYCFRGEGRKVKEKQRFKDIICSYVDFFQLETDKLPEGEFPKDENKELLNEIKQYTEEMQTVYGDVVQSKEKTGSNTRKKRQVYYIAGVSEEETAPESAKENIVESKSVQENTEESNKEESIKNKKKYMISEADRDKICTSYRNLNRINNNIEYAVAEIQQDSYLADQLKRLRDIEKALLEVKELLVNTDFKPVAKKMEILVDEMSQKLGKPVKLIVKGEDTLVDKTVREKISGALIHIIRNAIDHGIEDLDTRDRLGKPPMALIKLKFSTEDGRLKVSVKDDGSGIDKAKVLESAKKNGYLKKPEEMYSAKEVIDLILINGMTTTEVPGEYSGRGVGMDVINHNIREIGGKLKISSEEGMGTTVSMRF